MDIAKLTRNELEVEILSDDSRVYRARGFYGAATRCEELAAQARRLGE